MASNHYDTLDVSPAASQAEIKQAYRRLVKLFHPDTNPETADLDRIVRINAAYEILGDAQSRQSYDLQLGPRSQVADNQQRRSTTPQTQYRASRQEPATAQTQYHASRQEPAAAQTQYHASRQERAAAAQTQYRASRQTGRDADKQLEEWLRQVYQPVNRLLCRILNSLEAQIEQLAADPFDDELLEEFQEYLRTCRANLKQAQIAFRSRPNPASVAGAAAHLYYCLNQVADGLDELEYFPLNYDERYLHMGQELFRIAEGLHCEAQESIDAIA